MKHEKVKQLLRGIYEQMLPAVEEVFERDGFLAPVIFGLTAERSVIVMGLEYANREEKVRAYREANRRLREKHHAVGAVLFAKVRSDRGPAKPIRPGRDLDRAEGICAMLVTYGWKAAYLARFSRVGDTIVWDTAKPVRIRVVKDNLFPAFTKKSPPSPEPPGVNDRELSQWRRTDREEKKPMLSYATRESFRTLLRAVKNDDVALLNCIERSTGEWAPIICAMSYEEEVIDFIPFARMFGPDINPFEALTAP